MGDLDSILDALVDRVAARVVSLLSEQGATPAVPAAEPLLTRDQACTLLGVSGTTCDRLVAEGMPARYVGNSRRFLRSEILAWIATRPKRGAKRPLPAAVAPPIELRSRRTAPPR